MKAIGAVLVFLMSVSVMANNKTSNTQKSNGPLLIKSSGSGFTPAAWARSEVCELYQDKVVITKSYGFGESETTMSQTINIKLTGDIKAVIALSAKEKLQETDNQMCDGPSTLTRALSENLSEDLVLFNTGACGSKRKNRTGPYSFRLKDMIDTYCSKTYGF